MKNLMILLTLCMLTAACSTPAYFDLPTSRMEAPYVGGENFKGAITGGYGDPVFVETVTDITATPPTDTGRITTDGSLLAESIDFILPDIGIHFGIGKNFEISLNQSLYHLKYQIFGNPRASASNNEWLATISYDYFSQGRNYNDTDATASYSVEAKGSGFTFAFGYRFVENFVAYINYSKLNYSADTSIVQSATTYTFSGTGQQEAYSLGAVLQPKDSGIHLQAEATHSKSTWKALDDLNHDSVMLSVGYAW